MYESAIHDDKRSYAEIVPDLTLLEIWIARALWREVEAGIFIDSQGHRWRVPAAGNTLASTPVFAPATDKASLALVVEEMAGRGIPCSIVKAGGSWFAVVRNNTGEGATINEAIVRAAASALS